MCAFTYLKCYIQSIYLYEFLLLFAYFLSSNIEIFDIIIVEISLKSIHVEFSLEHVFKVVQCSHIETDLVLAYPFVKFSLNHLILNGGDNDRSSNIISLWQFLPNWSVLYGCGFSRPITLMQIFLGEANYLVGNMILSIVTNVMIVNHLSVVEFEFADLYEGEIVASSFKTLLDGVVVIV